MTLWGLVNLDCICIKVYLVIWSMGARNSLDMASLGLRGLLYGFMKGTIRQMQHASKLINI